MKQKLSSQTSSFLMLSALALVGGCFVIVISNNLLLNELSESSKSTPESQKSYNAFVQTAQASEILVLPSTQDWTLYSSLKYGIKFKHPKSWKVLPPKKQGEFTVMEIDPGKKFVNIKIYISQNSYYIMDGLPITSIKLDGQLATNVSNMLFGVSNTDYFYTFDLGRSLSLTPEFNAMVRSVEFMTPAE